MHDLFEKYDYKTLFHLLALSLIGVVAVASAMQAEAAPWWSGSAARQCVYVLIGLAAWWLIQRLDYRAWADFWIPLYTGGVVLLLLLFLLAPTINGTKSWFVIGPVRLQPSEPMKTIVVLAAAAFLSHAPGKLDTLRLLRLAGLIGFPMALIVLQPDMGTAITYAPLFLALAWLSGLRSRVLVVLFLIGLLAAPVMWVKVLKPYQKERIVNVFQPERDPAGSGYQVIQSKIAVGSGKVIGRGLFHGSQSRLEYLPARETDFILAVVAEETGFIGTMVVLGIYLSLLLRTIRTAVLARDRLGTLIAAGVASIWAGQLFINTGMVSGWMPTIGVPLPLLSYGGSSLIASFLAFGLVASVRSGRIVNQ